MKHRPGFLVLLAVSAVVTACGDGSTTGPSGDGGASVPNVAGVYTYESEAMLMTCSDGTTVPLPAATDQLTITQSGNRFSGELAIAATLGAPAGASFYENCLINPNSTYTCTGGYSDANAVITFNGGGRFTSSGFEGTIDLRMVLTGGAVCTWTKRERGTKLS